jgi:hypothetical protein
MGYTVNKPKNMYDNTEEIKKRSGELREEAKREIETQRKHLEDMRKNLAQYTCATIRDPNMYTCVSYDEPILPPTKSVDSKARNMYEEKIEELIKKINTISAENIILKSQVTLLITEVKKQREEKAKKEKKKDFDVKVYDSLNKVGGGFSGLYQKFIKWLNT